jgi:hypothetical protein
MILRIPHSLQIPSAPTMEVVETYNVILLYVLAILHLDNIEGKLAGVFETVRCRLRYIFDSYRKTG